MNAAICLSSFPEGKEINLQKYRPEVTLSGIRFIRTPNRVRCLCRLTYKGQKISKSLGTFSLDTFDAKIPQIIDTVQGYHQQLANGLHPFSEPTPSLESLSFAEFAQTIYLPNAQTRKKSYADDESRLRIHLLSEIGQLRMAEINVAKLNQLFTHLSSKGISNATINRIRALLSSIFNLAIDYDIIEQNPIHRIKKLKENNQIERYLNDEELSALMQVLEHPKQYQIANNVVLSIIKFLLITGVRKREAMDLKWIHIDLKTGVWLLGENKSGKARRIILSQAALDILASLPTHFDYAFANPNTGKPYCDIRKTFDKVMQAANIDNMRIHDLRHNFASLAVNSGKSLYIVQHLLGHASPQTTQRYAHLESHTLKQANEDIATLIQKHQSKAV